MKMTVSPTATRAAATAEEADATAACTIATQRSAAIE